MADRTDIEWTDATWTPMRAKDMTGAASGVTPADLGDAVRAGWHCERVSEGCRNCYAETFNRRLGTQFDFKPGHLAPRGPVEVFLDDALLLAPLRWRRPRRIFVCSMTDLFGAWVSDDMIDRVFAVMALCPQHTFQVLTKRPERARAYLDARHEDWSRDDAVWGEIHRLHDAGAKLDPQREISLPLPNVWLGTSVENQAAAEARIPHLLATPAAKRFLSCEPMLGPVNLINVAEKIDWVIVGGESGPNARPMHPGWARGLRDQCVEAGVSFFFKQWGEWAPEALAGIDWWGEDRFHEWEADGIAAARFGKKKAGRSLDGVTHDGMPSAAAA